MDGYAISGTADVLSWFRRARGAPAAVEGVAIRAVPLCGAAVHVLEPSAAAEIGDGIAALTNVAIRNPA